MPNASKKNWDEYVACAETVARTDGFVRLRDGILARAGLEESDTVADLGAGTGLLTLEAAAVAKRAWAIDVSPQMCEYLSAKARSAELTNVEPVTASVVSLPLVDESVSAVISNYCFHHLDDRDKMVALREVHRVLAPAGRVVIGDMMFSMSLADGRNRAVVRGKVRQLLAKGPAGGWRLVRNGARYLAGRWERPATPEWWEHALVAAGFEDVVVSPLNHEGGIASARKGDG